MNEKMDLEEHYPQNTISHGIISNETQFTLHFFSGSYFCYARDKSQSILDNISDWNVFVNFIIFFKRFTILVPSWPRFEKSCF